MIRNHRYLSVRIWVKDFPNMEKPKQTNEGPEFTFSIRDCRAGISNFIVICCDYSKGLCAHMSHNSYWQ